jgi:hypothetical protein
MAEKTAHPNCSGSGIAVTTFILICITLCTLLQFAIPYPIDDDTAYHFSVAQLTLKYGILHEFPWTPFSWQSDHYADKEFLFHLLFIPFTQMGFINAQRAVGIFCGALIVISLFFVLRAEGIRAAGTWALLPLTSSVFVFRFAQVRPHLLSITLAIVLLWALGRERLRLAFVAAALYPLAYVAFWQIPLILTLSIQSACFLSGKRVSWKAVGIVPAGIVTGMFLHPNTFNLIQLNWIHMADILIQNAWGESTRFHLASEFKPFSALEWGKFLIIVVFMASAAFALAWRDRRRNLLGLACAVAALVFGILTARTNRFAEYFVPFSVLAIAVASTCLKKKWLPSALMGLSLVYMLVLGTDPYKIMTSMETKEAYLSSDAGRLFRERIPAGAQVFTTAWDYTGSLMIALPERRFIVAADPTLFYKKDPELYDLWFTLSRFPPQNPASVIRGKFDSRFVISRNYHAYLRLFDGLRSDRSVKILHADERWVLYDLGAKKAL